MTHVGKLVGEHDMAVADLHLGMSELVLAHRHPQHLDRAERLAVEPNRLGRAIDDQIGRNAVIAFGNMIDRHVSFSHLLEQNVINHTPLPALRQSGIHRLEAPAWPTGSRRNWSPSTA
jgi:hypothetical protein